MTGTLGVIWFIAWWLLVYDSPQQHPRISAREKSHILSSLGETVSQKKVRFVKLEDMFSRIKKEKL